MRTLSTGLPNSGMGGDDSRKITGRLGLKELRRLCTNVCGFTLLSLVIANCDCWEDLFCQRLCIADEGCDVIW